jgi:YidC/Oxa1 family membrane protein insertase
MSQVESALAVQALKPRVDLIKDRFGDDKDKIQKETSVLYEQAGVNPLAGCLPTLATIPIFIGLYSSLTNVANDGLLDTQGFYWIPSLAGGFVSSQPRKKGTDKLQDMSLGGIAHLIPTTKTWSRNHPVMSMSATRLMSA